MFINQHKNTQTSKVWVIVSMEQVMGIEPTSQPWQGHVLAVVLHLQQQYYNIKIVKS